MKEETDIKLMIDEDILHCQQVWTAFSQDSQEMARLFHMLFGRYQNVIDGFCKGLHVVELYENSAQQGEIYRENICKMVERLIGFQENNYSNEGLIEYYMRKEHREISFQVDFTDIRLEIGMMDMLSQREKMDVIEKLGEMEAICAQVILKGEKWERMRGYLVWLSGKDVEIAMKLLPLFFKINL